MDARVFECLCETQMFKPRRVHLGALFARVRGVSNVTLRHVTPLTYIRIPPKQGPLSALLPSGSLSFKPSLTLGNPCDQNLSCHAAIPHLI
jgi:hypothetical protein